MTRRACEEFHIPGVDASRLEPASSLMLHQTDRATSSEREVAPFLAEGDAAHAHAAVLRHQQPIAGIDADAALTGMTARVAAVDGDLATLDISYPLLGQTVNFQMELIRRDGRWYSADAVRKAEAELAQPLPAAGPTPVAQPAA